MARRRLYVFGAIIVVGVLIGIFCLPDSSDREEIEAHNLHQGGETTTVGPGGTLPPANIAKTPGVRAEILVKKARSMTNTKDRIDCFVEAYRTDPTGRWGGEAAAEIGHVWKKAGDTDKARRWYAVARRAPVSPETLASINDELEAARERETAPATARIKTLSYKVQPRDSLWKIAKRYAVTIGAIKKTNNLTRDMIRVDKVLKVPKGPFDVRVTKSNHTLQLLQNGKPVKTYLVGLGADNSTPDGTFTVTSKLVDPVWYSDQGRLLPDDPRNILGSRWIGFNGRIGIHGTRESDEHTIGKDASKGCIRMRDGDVKELYDFLVQGQSKVTIVSQ